MKLSINKIYKILFTLSPWAIFAGMLHYHFRSILPAQGIFYGEQFFDFLTFTDFYIYALLAVFFFGYFTKKIKVQTGKVPKGVWIAIICLLFAFILQLLFQETLEPILSTPSEYFRSLFILPISFTLLIFTTLNEKDIKRLMASYLMMVAVFCLAALVQYFGGIFPGDQADFMDRLVWPYVDFVTLEATSANWVAFFVMPAFVLSFTRLKFNKKDIKGVWLRLFLLTGITLYLTQSYGAYGAALGALALYALRAFPIKKLIAFGLITACVITAGYFHQQTTWKYQVLTDQVEYTYASSADSRSEIYKMNFHMISENPVLGVGLNQYQSYFAANQEQVLGKELNESHTPPHAHNFFMSFWTSLGLFGFLGMFALMLSVLFHTRLKPQHPAIFVLAAIMAHGLIDSYYWAQEIAFFFWLMLAMAYLYKVENKGLKSHS
jgi:O-antigen ligase